MCESGENALPVQFGEVAQHRPPGGFYRQFGFTPERVAQRGTVRRHAFGRGAAAGEDEHGEGEKPPAA
jgi:hypothetical protein